MTEVSKPTTLKSIVLDARAGMAALAATRDANQRTYVAGLLRREAVTLAEQCWMRHVWLNDSDEWLAAHRDELDADDLKAREDRWLLNLRQYQVAMDLLDQVLEALQAIPESAQQPVTSSVTAPLVQKELL